MLLSTIKQIVPDQRIKQAPGEMHALGNDGEYIVFAQTEDEIASVVKYANENNLSLIPEGNGTKRGFGGVGGRASILLSLKQYSGVVEHSEGDMTMTCRAGTTISEINEYLADFQQMLPLDSFWPTHATIGGVIAANDSGPKRLRYGSSRDIVIGTRLVFPDGQVQRTGGKVVKNVAGYDMNKLLVGSMGTLAVLTDITVKLRPIPKYQSVVLLSFEQANSSMIKTFATSLLDSYMEPVTLEWINPFLAEKLTGQSNPILAVSFEDVEKSVRYQEDWLHEHLPSGTKMKVLRQEEAAEWWSTFAKLPPIGGADDDMEVALKIGSTNLEVLDVVEEINQLAAKLGVTAESHGGLGHGITRAYLKGDEEAVAAFVTTLRSSVEGKKGYVQLQHAPLSLRKQLDPWGTKPMYFPLIEGIKQKVDPNRILNPKRFIGGI